MLSVVKSRLALQAHNIEMPLRWIYYARADNINNDIPVMLYYFTLLPYVPPQPVAQN